MHNETENTKRPPAFPLSILRNKRGAAGKADAYLTVRLLATSTGTVTTELLGLRSSGVGDQQSAVVSNKELAELKGRGGIVVLGVVGNERLGDSLADGVDLRGLTTTGHTETDVDSAVESKDQDKNAGKRQQGRFNRQGLSERQLKRDERQRRSKSPTRNAPSLWPFLSWPVAVAA